MISSVITGLLWRVRNKIMHVILWLIIHTPTAVFCLCACVIVPCALPFPLEIDTKITHCQNRVNNSAPRPHIIPNIIIYVHHLGLVAYTCQLTGSSLVCFVISYPIVQLIRNISQLNLQKQNSIDLCMTHNNFYSRCFKQYKPCCSSLNVLKVSLLILISMIKLILDLR